MEQMGELLKQITIDDVTMTIVCLSTVAAVSYLGMEALVWWYMP